MVRNTYNGRDKTWGFNLSPFQISSARYSFLIPFYNFESYALENVEIRGRNIIGERRWGFLFVLRKIFFF